MADIFETVQEDSFFNFIEKILMNLLKCNIFNRGKIVSLSEVYCKKCIV